jgi:hypothetical protein
VLLALSVGVGLGVLVELMGEEVVGPKSRHIALVARCVTATRTAA